MFIFMLLIMILLATTELGTDSWISDIMQGVLSSPTKGILFLVYTSSIMFVLRFFAGGVVHKISPLGLLATCAAIACPACCGWPMRAPRSEYCSWPQRCMGWESRSFGQPRWVLLPSNIRVAAR